MAADDNLYPRNTIDGAAEEGLVRSISGIHRIAPWGSITQVHAALVDHNDRTIFILGVSFADSSTFLLGEIEPGWSEVVDALCKNLAIEPFEEWGPRILANPELFEWFNRGELRLLRGGKNGC